MRQIMYIASTEKFAKITGTPISYWVTEKEADVFTHSVELRSIANPRQGLITGDVNRFVRKWYECSRANTNFCCGKAERKKEGKWFPYSNGGSYRKWYGNNEDVVNWENEGNEVINFKDENGKQRSRPQNQQYYFSEGGTWTAISSSLFSVRYFNEGFLFSNAGMAIYAEKELLRYVIGFLNCLLAQKYLSIFNEGLNYNQGDIAKLPIIVESKKIADVNNEVEKLINESKSDWDSYETSWDFKKHPLI